MLRPSPHRSVRTGLPYTAPRTSPFAAHLTVAISHRSGDTVYWLEVQRWFHARVGDARLPLPYNGSLGHQFATYKRYYGSLRLLSSHLGLLRLSLVSRYLAVPLFSIRGVVTEELHHTSPGAFGHPALLRLLDRDCSSRRGQISQVPESTLCTLAPLYDPGWLDDTTVTE